MAETRIDISSDPDGTHRVLLKVTKHDLVAWDPERLDMLLDAEWLIRQALAGRTTGPLTLPRTQLPIRTVGGAE
jgi:hypothetical protein